jgi:hypothetical protein
LQEFKVTYYSKTVTCYNKIVTCYSKWVDKIHCLPPASNNIPRLTNFMTVATFESLKYIVIHTRSLKFKEVYSLKFKEV